MSAILLPVTYMCNLSCPKCCVSRNNTAIELEKSIKNLAEHVGKIEWVYITGGEPLLLPNLFEVCDEVRAMGFKVGITTNGTIFNPDIADHVDRFGVSLDGHEEYHDAYRGEGVFKKATSLLKEVKSRGKCETVVMSVAFKGNEEALLKLKPIVEQLDPTYWQIQRDATDPTVIISEQLN